MKRLLTLVALVALAVFLVPYAHGQATLSSTYLSQAITSTGATQIFVASATGIVADALPTTPGSELVIDHEAMIVRAISGTTLTVQRGIAGTRTTTHLSGAAVWFGPRTYFKNASDRMSEPSGSCIPANETVLPVIYLPTAKRFNCTGTTTTAGFWYDESSLAEMGRTGPSGPSRYCVATGMALATAGTNTTLSAATAYTYVSEIFIPRPMLLTGISLLAGGTAGAADFWEVAIYGSAGGAVLAQSATIASPAAANAYKDFAFAAKLSVAAGRYWIAMQSSSTTDKIQTVSAANSHGNILTQKPASTAYGTFPSLTPPTTFTDAVGILGCVY